MHDIIAGTKEVISSPPAHRRTPSTQYEPMSAATMRSPGWMAMPDDDDVNQVNKQAWSLSATMWWLIVSSCMLAVLTYGEAPWWLISIVAAELYVSLRRVVINMSQVAPTEGQEAGPKRSRRLRHFTSVRLAEGSPIDDIVARFLALDDLSSVRSLELGSNSSTSHHSRGHSLALLVTFAGTSQRNHFLKCRERAAFMEFLEPFVAEWFTFDFESGAIFT